MKQFLLSITAFVCLSANVSAQCVTQFYDGFETGSFSPNWVPGTGSYTNSVAVGTAPVGNDHLVMQSNNTNSFYQGLIATFTPGQPSYMSWWMKTNLTSGANGYVIIGDGNVASDNGIIFCYFNTGSTLRFYGSTGFNHPVAANTWYHVEARNMNWTSRTSDIYVDNVLILSGWPFRSSTATSIDRICLHSLVAATAEYDDFLVGSPPVTGTAISTGVTCFGGTNGSATVTAGGGTGAYTYSWAPTGGIAATATGLTAGIYSCTITDGAGCTHVTTVTVAAPTAIAVVATQTNVLCNGANTGAAALSVSGGTPGYTYMWSSGGMGATESGLLAGAYTYTVTDAGGCTATQSVNIAEPAALLSTATNSGNVCVNDTATLIGSATGGTSGYTYVWTPGNLPGATVSDIPSGTTTYTLTVTDANGCTTSSTTGVQVNLPPIVNLGPDTTVCLGMFLDAQNPGCGYLWNDNSTQPALGVTATGTYYVTVTDINGCSSSDTVNVIVDQQPNGGIISSSSGVDICPGDSVFLSSFNDVGTLNWWVLLVAAPFWQNVGTGNPFASVPAIGDTGTYQFMAIASNGVCPDDTSNVITVIVHVPPMVNLSDTVVCGGVILDAQNTGPNISYLWSDLSVQQQLTVFLSGNYSVVVTDQFGCTGSDAANVTVNAYPTGLTANASTLTTCLDDANVILTGTPAGGVWSGPGVIGSAFDPSIGVGAIPLTYTFTDTTNGCAASASVTISVNACVGVNEIADAADVNVYPNPNNGMFFIAVNGDVSTLLLEVTDIEGRLVYTSETSNVQSGATQQLDLSSENSGVYFLRITADQQHSTQKIIITK